MHIPTISRVFYMNMDSLMKQYPHGEKRFCELHVCKTTSAYAGFVWDISQIVDKTDLIPNYKPEIWMVISRAKNIGVTFHMYDAQLQRYLYGPCPSIINPTVISQVAKLLHFTLNGAVVIIQTWWRRLRKKKKRISGDSRKAFL